MSVQLVICNCSPTESAQLARRLVTTKLAACVNVIPITSYYEWQGEFCEDAEHTLLIKTSVAAFPNLERKLTEWHSYDVPEIIAVTPDAVSAAYGKWVLESVKA